MGVVAVTGSASGLGAATATRLAKDGHRVIGVDLRDADVIADLSTVEGRREAIDGVRAAAGGSLDALLTFAGLAGLSDRPGDVVVSVNYFGAVALLDGLRDLLEAAGESAALAISSNSTSTMPGVPLELVDACLSGDEELARSIGNDVTSVRAYPATKLAIARWVRRHAVTPEWVGAGIRLNALAPGSINTAMTDGVRKDPVFGQFIDLFPVPTGPGSPEDVAGIAAFLVGPDARFFCGSVVYVDGGTDALLRADDWPSITKG